MGNSCQLVAQEHTLGAEILEADDRLVVNEPRSVVNLDKLEAAAAWRNHATDYQLVDLAKEHGLTMTATNVPRRYASWVYKHGLDGLEDDPGRQAYLPSLLAFDPTLPGYGAMLAMAGGHGRGCPWRRPSKTPPWPTGFASAQKANPSYVNGSTQPELGRHCVVPPRGPAQLERLTIHGDTQVDVDPDSTALNRADFLLLTQAQMTRTH